MPNTFRDKNGANLSGHADKWSDKNRRDTSHDAGQGSRGSRNMGTGIQGKLNTQPTDAVDTSNMDKSEKLKYFNSLGLMGTPEPEHKETLKDWPNTLRRIFKDEPVYLKDISNIIKSTPREHYQQVVQDGFNATNDIIKSTDDTYDIYAAIMQAIQN